MCFNVNFNVFFKLIKVHLLVSELYMDECILRKPYTFHMFRSLILSFSGRCVTKDKYIEILQNILNQCRGIKRYILKIMRG